MSVGSLSSKVKNMKFMQTADDRKRQTEKDTAESEKNKKIKDISEWSLPVSTRTLKVIKLKGKKVRKVGYSTISALGPVNTVSVGRKVMTNDNDELKQTVKEPGPDELVDLRVTEENSLSANQSQKHKIKKSKKSKKTKSIMDAFKTKEDDVDGDSDEDLTSKNLLKLWKKTSK